MSAANRYPRNAVTRDVLRTMAEPGPTFVNRNSISCNMQAIVKNHILFLFLCLGTTSFLPAQASVHGAGGDAAGTGGSVAFSIGQVHYQHSGTSAGQLLPGVQQAVEISTGNARSHLASAAIQVYPNPTHRSVVLSASETLPNFRYTLSDIRGTVLIQGVCHGQETRVALDALAPGLYLLQCSTSDHQTIQTTRIIKTQP